MIAREIFFFFLFGSSVEKVVSRLNREERSDGWTEVEAGQRARKRERERLKEVGSWKSKD